jgi:hypothetical protein
VISARNILMIPSINKGSMAYNSDLGLWNYGWVGQKSEK